MVLYVSWLHTHLLLFSGEFNVCWPCIPFAWPLMFMQHMCHEWTICMAAGHVSIMFGKLTTSYSRQYLFDMLVTLNSYVAL